MWLQPKSVIFRMWLVCKIWPSHSAAQKYNPHKKRRDPPRLKKQQPSENRAFPRNPAALFGQRAAACVPRALWHKPSAHLSPSSTKWIRARWLDVHKDPQRRQTTKQNNPIQQARALRTVLSAARVAVEPGVCRLSAAGLRANSHSSRGAPCRCTPGPPTS